MCDALVWSHHLKVLVLVHSGLSHRLSGLDYNITKHQHKIHCRCSYTITSNPVYIGGVVYVNAAPKSQLCQRFNWDRIIELQFNCLCHDFAVSNFIECSAEHLNVLHNKSTALSWGFHIYRINDKTR